MNTFLGFGGSLCKPSQKRLPPEIPPTKSQHPKNVHPIFHSIFALLFVKPTQRKKPVSVSTRFPTLHVVSTTPFKGAPQRGVWTDDQVWKVFFRIKIPGGDRGGNGTRLTTILFKWMDGCLVMSNQKW